MFTFVYFGSFRISADILEGMVAGGLMPTVVVCNPDRASGRKQEITAPAIKQLILKNKWPIKIYQPEKLEIENLKLEIGGIDLAVVMGYPQIISESILNIPRKGTIGVHPSLLPKHRGASPIQTTLLQGDSKTGVTLYLIDKDVDHGPIIAQETVDIESEDTNTMLEKKLATCAANLIIKTMPLYTAGQIIPQEQNHKHATFTHKFKTADGEVNMVMDAPLGIYRKIKAFNPEPSVWTMNFPGYEGKRVKLLSALWNDSKLKITQIQVEGKKPMLL